MYSHLVCSNYWVKMGGRKAINFIARKGRIVQKIIIGISISQSLKKDLFLLLLIMCMCASVHVRAGVHRGQSLWISLELKL